MRLDGIKIIIWDLDETIWKGTFSEDKGVVINEDIIKYIKKLNKIGVINSICSNNNFDEISLFLKSNKIFDLFITPSINYQPKGIRIKKMLKSLGLRDQNALFVDDNFFNLQEAKFYNKNIRCIDITKININNLIDKIIKNTNPNSLRFSQYKNLEIKINKMEKFDTNEDFLKKSNIIIDIVAINDKNFEQYKERISEMISRTNQLNYTKNRESIEMVPLRFESSENFIIKAKDDYGNYGTIGFASFDRKNVYHYLFSCRTINMGIESHVASLLDLPDFIPDENVISKFKKGKCAWIKIGKVESIRDLKAKKDTLFIGGCDLSRALHFMSNKEKVEKYFNYVTKKGVNVHRDSIDLLLSDYLSDSDLEFIESTVPFLASHGKLSIKDIKNVNFEKYKYIIYSPLIDYNQEKYTCEKIKNYYLSSTPFFHKEWNEKDLEDLSKRSKIDKGSLEKMIKIWKPSKKPLSVYRKQINRLFEKFSGAKKVIVLLGATNTYSNLDSDKVARHILYNKIFLEESKKFSNIEFIYPDEFIKGRSDFTNAIRHYSSRVYKCLGDEIDKRTKK